MNARERILKTFEHEEPDRIPSFVQSVMPVFNDQLNEKFEDEIEDEDIIYIMGKDFTLIKKLGFDSSWGAGGAHVSPPSDIMKNYPLPKLEDPSERLDISGRISKVSTLNGHTQTWYKRGFLNTEEKADEWYDRYFNCEWQMPENIIDMVNNALKENMTDDFVPVCGVMGVFEPILEGLGIRLFSKLLRKKPDKLKKYFELRTRQCVKQAKAAAELDYDVYSIADDSAFKQNTFIDPKLHREIVVPCYKQIVKEIRKAGKFIFFHSDGFTEPYFPGLIEAGFNGVESLEPGAGMDLKHLKETYGDKLTLIGNIDCSRLLPYGTKAEVVEAVKTCIRSAGKGGGYILSPCTDLTDSCKFENVETMLATLKEYGKYPLNI